MSRAGSASAPGRCRNVTVLHPWSDPDEHGAMQQTALPATDRDIPRRDEPPASGSGPDRERLELTSGLRSLRQPDWTDRWIWPAALAVALLAHAALICAMTHRPDD